MSDAGQPTNGYVTRGEFGEFSRTIGQRFDDLSGDIKTLSRTVTAAEGGRDRISTPNLLGWGALLLVAAAFIWPLLQDIRNDGAAGYARNEQRIERLEAAHALEVARNNLVEFRQGRTEIFQELVIGGKLRLEGP